MRRVRKKGGGGKREEEDEDEEGEEKRRRRRKGGGEGEGEGGRRMNSYASNHRHFFSKVAELKEGLKAQARELNSQLEMSKKEAENTRKELQQEKESCLSKVLDVACMLC